MDKRDKYGNYVNDEDVVIKINTDKNGKDHISFYGSDVDEDHDAVHVDVDYENKSWSSTTHDADKSDTEKSSGTCYLTSACLKHFKENFDDNCDELTILRNFRDRFVLKEDIEHYYKVAPIIVETIESIENNNYIYNFIYENIIIKCIDAIKSGDYDSAYNRYKSSVTVLEEQFARPSLEIKMIKTLKLKV